jgi:Na+/melibiose symporter-like transporter
MRKSNLIEILAFMPFLVFRWGIRYTLLIGLNLQFVGLGMLFAWQDSWSKTDAIIYVTVAQMLCGIAKDLTKLGDDFVPAQIFPFASARLISR